MADCPNSAASVIRSPGSEPTRPIPRVQCGPILTPLLPDRGERASPPAGISAAGFCRRAPKLRSLWWISLILMSLTLDRKVTLRDSRRQLDEPSPAKVLADGSIREKHCGCNRQRPAACAHA